METVGSESIINYIDMPFEDLRNYRVSPLKIRDTGWTPQYSLEDGIVDLATIIREDRVKNTSSNLFSNEKFLKEKEN